jgi:hypothetical protein
LEGALSGKPLGSSRALPDAITMIYLIVGASVFSEKWIPLFGPML